MSRITGTANVSETFQDKYLVECTALCSCDYTYDPGRMYMPNGDPGYPPDESYDDLEVEDFDDVKVYKLLPDGDVEEVSETWYKENQLLLDTWLNDISYNLCESDVIWNFENDYDEDDYYDDDIDFD